MNPFINVPKKEVPAYVSSPSQFHSSPQFQRMSQFLEFFQQLQNDIFSDTNAIFIDDIQKYVIELLAINPIQTHLEKQYSPFQRSASEQSLQLLANLIPYPQKPKDNSKTIPLYILQKQT